MSTETSLFITYCRGENNIHNFIVVDRFIIFLIMYICFNFPTKASYSVQIMNSPFFHLWFCGTMGHLPFSFCTCGSVTFSQIVHHFSFLIQHIWIHYIMNLYIILIFWQNKVPLLKKWFLISFTCSCTT